MGGRFSGLGSLSQQLLQILQLLCRHLFPSLHQPSHILSKFQRLSFQVCCRFPKPIPLSHYHLMRHLCHMCLIFPNFHFPPELIHHLLLTSLCFCHLLLQPFPRQLLLLCTCFHSQKLVCIMLCQSTIMLPHFVSSVLCSGLGRHL